MKTMITQVLAIILLATSCYSSVAAEGTAVATQQASTAVPQEQAQKNSLQTETKATTLPEFNFDAYPADKQKRFVNLDMFLSKFPAVSNLFKHVYDTAVYVEKCLKIAKTRPAHEVKSILGAERNQVIANGKQAILDAATALFGNGMAITMFNDIANLPQEDKDAFILEVCAFVKAPNFNSDQSLLRKIIAHKLLTKEVVAQECNNYMVGEGKTLFLTVHNSVAEFKALVSYIDAIRAAVKKHKQ